MVQATEKQIREHYRELTKFLIEEKLTITTMESATSGQIASLITDTEGSSAVLKGAFVTYCNEAKVMQGVPENIISEYGVYSGETATAMANACKKTYSADIGIGVTGTMGNVDPNNNDSVPGEVYFAIAYNKNTWSFKFEIEPKESRLAYKLAVAELIYQKLMQLIKDCVKFSMKT